MVQRNDLVLLDDDRKFFPRCDSVSLYRLDTLERQPELLAGIRRETVPPSRANSPTARNGGLPAAQCIAN